MVTMVSAKKNIFQLLQLLLLIEQNDTKSDYYCSCGNIQ